MLGLGDLLVGPVRVLLFQIVPVARIVGFVLEPSEMVFGDDLFPHCPRDVEPVEDFEGWDVELVEEQDFVGVVVFLVGVPSASVPVGLVFGVGFPANFMQMFGHVVG